MGLLCRAGTFRLLLMGLGNFARIEEIIMNKRNFEKSVRTLKSLRDMYYSQLDISVVTELNAVIVELEKADSQLNIERKQNLGLRALQVIGVVISLVSNIRDLMK